VAYQVNAAPVEWNPSAERLRELTEKMPNSSITEFGNVVVKARVDSRSAKSTYIVEDSTNATKQTITRDEYDRVAAQQDAYIAGHDMVVVDGYIGPDPDFRTKARLIIEASNANVAGMLKQLYYPGAGHHGHLHAEPGCARLPGRPAHRRGLGRQHHPRAQLGLLR
jgi:phosphoenolpyruvate carboxykinase (ATP)